LDYSACYRCQNGIREGLEECDGDDLGSATCPVGDRRQPGVQDELPPRLCALRAVRRGNLDPGEYCDDGNTDAHDGCSPTCQSECGDGILEPPLEMCDDGANANGDGCNAFCEIPMPYAGGGSEVDDGCALQWGAASDAPLGATLTCTDGQSPCDRGPASDETCRFLVSSA
jgi:cysteine-rich repeat protein